MLTVIRSKRVVHALRSSDIAAQVSRKLLHVLQRAPVPREADYRLARHLPACMVVGVGPSWGKAAPFSRPASMLQRTHQRTLLEAGHQGSSDTCSGKLSICVAAPSRPCQSARSVPHLDRSLRDDYPCLLWYRLDQCVTWIVQKRSRRLSGDVIAYVFRVVCVQAGDGVQDADWPESARSRTELAIGEQGQAAATPHPDS